MHCAMMQHMTAVGHRHVRPTLTNTRMVNPPTKQNFGYPASPATKKRWFSSQRNQPVGEDDSYCFGCLSVTVCALVSSKAPFSDLPMSFITPF